MLEGKDFWAKALEGVDFTPLEAPQAEWNVVENTSEKAEQNYVFSRGLLKFDLSVYRDKAMIGWDSKLPQHFYPGHSTTDFLAFIEEAVYKIPSKFNQYPGRTMADCRSVYGAHSSVTLKFGKDTERKYKLSKEEEKLDLAMDFLRRPDDITQVWIRGAEVASSTVRIPGEIPGVVRKVGPAPDNDYSYIFGFTIPKNLGEASRAIFLLPNQPRASKVWNPYLMQWMMGLHSHADTVSDLKKPAGELSELVHPLVDAAFRKKHGLSPQP